MDKRQSHGEKFPPDIIKIAVDYLSVKLQVMQTYFLTDSRTLAMPCDGRISTDNYVVFVFVRSTIPIFVDNSRRIS